LDEQEVGIKISSGAVLNVEKKKTVSRKGAQAQRTRVKGIGCRV
jgi:hypothetical protein